MKAKEYLQQIEKYNKLIENKLIERDQWRSMALSISTRSDSERVQSSGNQQRMATAVERMVDIERELDSMIDRLADAKIEIIKTIEQLNATEYDILHKVYVQGKTLYEVADGKRSYSWVTTVHGRALKKVQKMLDAR